MTVWASGAWADGQGILPVKGLDAKLAVAAEFGAKTFFVPQMQRDKGPAVGRGTRQDDDCAVALAQPNPRKAFQEYWLRLEVPPGRDAARALRKGYYLRLPDDARATILYGEHPPRGVEGPGCCDRSPSGHAPRDDRQQGF